MNESIAIGSSTIIGAMTSPSSKSPFNRAHLVARGGHDKIMQVRAYTSEGMAEGPVLAEEDWHALVAAEQALLLPQGFELTAGAALWVLRPGLPRRERILHDLRVSSVLLHEHIAVADAWLCLVNEGRAAAIELRDRWHREAVEASRGLAWAGQWAGAEAEAEIAHAIARGLDPETLALLIFVYEHRGRDVRAKGIRTMAHRSRGEEFARQVDERLAPLRRRLAEPGERTSRASRARGVWKQIREVARRGLEETLKSLPNPEATAA